MTDFEPHTDRPERIDEDDTPVASSAQSRDEAVQKRRKRILQGLTLLIGIGLLIYGVSLFRVVVALVIGYLIIAIGFAVLGAFARPIPEAPPPGELRRVRLNYRCSSCGAELRMTLANDAIPEPPRHCSDEMELVTALEDV